jgi:predicted amidohydrolase
MSRKAKIGLMQVTTNYTWDTATKQDHMLTLAKRCLDDGADLVFMPEAYQYTNDRGILNRPDDLTRVSGEWKERCAELAKCYKAYVVPWDYEIDSCGRKFNCSYILDRTGREIGRFCKVHLTYGELERMGLTNGADFPVFDLDIGKVGIMICFDNYWVESARIMGLRGAELILYPLNGDTLRGGWELKMRARAIDNSLYVASCQIQNKYDIAYTGLVDPNGDVIAKLTDDDTHSVVEIEMGREVITSSSGNTEFKENIREYLLRTRQTPSYGPLVEPIEAWTWKKIFFNKLS